MNEEVLHIDYETRSEIDLRTHGVYVYAEHPSTQIILISWAFNDEPVQYAFTFTKDSCPASIRNHILAGKRVEAHNAAFEIILSRSHAAKFIGLPPLSPNQVTCTMVQSYALGLPGSMEATALNLGLEELKDMEGKKLMLKIATQPMFHPTPDEWERFAKYGAQDVVVGRAISKRQISLTTFEKKLWALDQKINDHGVLIDTKSARAAIDIADRERKRLNEEMVKITNNEIATCTATGQILDWLKWNKIEVDSVAKAEVTELLSKPDLPQLVRRVLELRREASKTSVKKLDAMIRGANSDGRVRGTLQFLGGYRTGRWAGRRLQTHNFPRGRLNAKELSFLFSVISRPRPDELLRVAFGSVLQVLSDSLRGFIIAPPGHWLLYADFAGIEARVLAWLAGEEHVLQAFRDGKDIYVHAYAKAFGVDYNSVTEDQRQIGKVIILSSGYQGGVDAFQAMAKIYNVQISDAQANEAKTHFRNSHRNIVKFWYDIENAVVRSIQNPGERYFVRQIGIVTRGSFLFIRLPSGRLLSYPYPKIQQKQTPWGTMKDAPTFMGEEDNITRWCRVSTYGGKLVENISQSVSRDVLGFALVNLDEAGFEIPLHVHDEILAEVSDSEKEIKKSEMKRIMELTPPWAEGLPLSVKVSEGRRYYK